MQTLRELFSRLTFNILCGNTDDHARNHAAFWDGRFLELTPAYDICPQLRVGEEASQAMLIIGSNRSSKLTTTLEAAKHFLLDESEARAIIEYQIEIIRTRWDDVAEEAALSEIDSMLFRKKLFLRPYAFEGYTTHL